LELPALEISGFGPKAEVALADARQKSDSNGLVGGPLLCGFSFAERVLRYKCDADLISGNAH